MNKEERAKFIHNNRIKESKKRWKKEKPKCIICKNLIPFERFFYGRHSHKYCSKKCGIHRHKEYFKNITPEKKEKIRIKNLKRIRINYYKNREKILQYQNKYNYKHKKEKAEYDKIYRFKNLDKKIKYDKKYYRTHKKEIKEWSKKYNEKNKKKISKRNKLYTNKNKEKINKRRNKWEKEKRKKDISFKMKLLLKNRIRYALKNNKKSNSTMNLVGCSLQELKKHLEKQFKQGMTWKNHSLYGWHIDHIKPCASFDLSNPEEQKKCFHYTNLQPLWAIDNIKKSNKI